MATVAQLRSSVPGAWLQVFEDRTSDGLELERWARPIPGLAEELSAAREDLEDFENSLSGITLAEDPHDGHYVSPRKVNYIFG